MANLTETEIFDAGVYQLETTDPVLGGPGGVANRQAQSLGNRTKWLKAQIDIITSLLSSGVQPLDALLTALSNLTTSADKMAYFTGADTVALATLTAFARSLLDDADASAALSTLGVSTFIKTLLDDADAATARTTLGVDGAISAAVSALVNSAPSTLDTLKELADALGSDPNFATTMTNALSAKAPIVNPHFDGTVYLPDAGIMFDSDIAKDTGLVWGGDGIINVKTNGVVAGRLAHSGEFDSSLAASGYQKLPSGLILQWGLSSSISRDSYTTITLPITFPAAAVLLSATARGNTLDSGGENYSVSTYPVNTSSFRIYNDSDSNQVYWFAIGY